MSIYPDRQDPEMTKETISHKFSLVSQWVSCIEAAYGNVGEGFLEEPQCFMQLNQQKAHPNMKTPLLEYSAQLEGSSTEESPLLWRSFTAYLTTGKGLWVLYISYRFL